MKSTTHNKIMFFLLLIPSYFIILIISFAILYQFGSIMWSSAMATIAVNVIGAWFLSKKQSFLLHTLGFLCFLIPGGILAVIQQVQNKTSYGPAILNVYAGVFIVLIGAIAYLYQIIRMLRRRNKN